jgi:hypothetical protein
MTTALPRIRPRVLKRRAQLLSHVYRIGLSEASEFLGAGRLGLRVRPLFIEASHRN